MARKHLPPLPFLPPAQAARDREHAERMNQAINQMYRHLAERQDDLILTATATTQLPAASAGGRFAVIGSSVYVDATGSVWLQVGGGSGAGTYIVDTPTGTQDSSNLTFTIAHTPISGELLTVNEAVMQPGVHYSRVGTTITFVAGQAPDSYDVIQYRYYY